MDWSSLKELEIPEGTVKQVDINGETVWKKEEADLPYLCFTFSDISTTSSGPLELSKKKTTMPDLDMEYSLDKKNWLPFVVDTGVRIDSTYSNKSIYIRGNNSVFSTSSSLYYYFRVPHNAAVSGSVMSLLSKKCEDIPLKPYIFTHLFYNTSRITSAPSLPATTLAESCYDTMFYGCTGLISAPSLPATTLAKSCYNSMFSNTGLTSAPSLPATTLAESCYDMMFYQCAGLISAPSLPATTLAKSCYNSMFNKCTSLTSVPRLSATTLAESCYGSMFYQCTKIKLSEVETDEYIVPYRIPTSGTGSMGSSSLNNMFGSTGGAFTGTPEINKTYYLSSTNAIVE